MSEENEYENITLFELAKRDVEEKVDFEYAIHNYYDKEGEEGESDERKEARYALCTSYDQGRKDGVNLMLNYMHNLNIELSVKKTNGEEQQ